MLIGKPAPSLTLPSYAGGEFRDISFDTFRGKWLVLFFYPLDFTFICPTEITAFSKRFEEFQALDCEILGASTDSEHSHKAWCASTLGELRFPLLSDKSHALSRAMDVLDEVEGTTVRATFIIDPMGIVRWANIHDNSVGRSVSEVIRALNALQTGELCPVEWAPGGETLGKA